MSTNSVASLRREGAASSGDGDVTTVSAPLSVTISWKAAARRVPRATAVAADSYVTVAARACGGVTSGAASRRHRTRGACSEPADVRQLLRRRLDLVARLEQHRRRVPRAVDELIARAVRHRRLDRLVAELHFLLVHVHRDLLLRRERDLLLQPLQVRLRHREAGDAEHHAVAEEDLA